MTIVTIYKNVYQV